RSGIMLVTQFRTHTRIVKDTLALPLNEQMMIVGNLSDSNQKLRKEVETLQDQLNAYEGTVGKSELDRMVADVNQLRIVNGVSEVSGPGIEVTINANLVPEDLQDMVNELRDAGAEAIAVNGHRVVVDTSFVYQGGEVVINGDQIIRPPYVVDAVGNADDLERALNRQGGLVASLQGIYTGAQIAVYHKTNLVLPKSDHAITMEVASVPS
ncbi:MAG: DUF881 domain-containing protein, partial [Dehalococcoidales bacterium]|nr:DUF881 domain-containing protein [Dehalococcoidales bacterium]